jgi:coenzyme F420-reducing hydrogenase gamma subunit
MEQVLENDAELKFRIYEIPTSAIMINGKKVKYFDFISSLKNDDCNRALKRIVPRIDMVKINAIIEGTPFITELQKRFYIKMLANRKERILDYSLAVLEKVEKKRLRTKNIDVR